MLLPRHHHASHTMTRPPSSPGAAVLDRGYIEGWTIPRQRFAGEGFLIGSVAASGGIRVQHDGVCTDGIRALFAVEAGDDQAQSVMLSRVDGRDDVE